MLKTKEKTELKRLEQSCKELCYSCSILTAYKIKNNKDNRKTIQDIIEGLEDCLGVLKHDILAN